MRKGIIFAIALGSAMVWAPPALAQASEKAAQAAELKIGLGVEKMELTGEAASFKIAEGTRLFVWTRVSGCAESKITIAFHKGDKEVSKQELDVPHSPYRTHAYRTFRAGDAGEWTAKVLSGEGAEIGSASFLVEFEK